MQEQNPNSHTAQNTHARANTRISLPFPFRTLFQHSRRGKEEKARNFFRRAEGKKKKRPKQVHKLVKALQIHRFEQSPHTLR